jgi:hypothetical protein
VHTERRVPVVEIQVEDRAGADNAGRVDENVDLSEQLERLCDERARLLGIGDVDRQRPAGAACSRDLGCCLVCQTRVGSSPVEGRPEVGDHHLRLLARESARDFVADSAGASRHDGHLSGKPGLRPDPGHRTAHHHATVGEAALTAWPLADPVGRAVRLCQQR